MKKFSVSNWLYQLNEEDVPVDPNQPPAPPNAQKPPAQPPSKSPNQAFSSLQGQTISGVSYSANGDAGGVIKIALKNSYIPFQIYWVNQKVTVTDMTGNIIDIGESQ
jgi:hypothetical protein